MKSDTLIYHIFADKGVESEVLDGYGSVVRVGIDTKDTNESHPVRADATSLPLREVADLALLHPPCTRWSKMTNISGDPEGHPNLIPEAREIGQTMAEDYVIENVPGAPLNDPVVLNGKMFGLTIEYERAFETSFRVRQPPRQRSLSTATSPYFSADRTREWWAAVKGYPDEYSKQHMAKNCVPAPYIRFLLREWMCASRDAEACSDYTRHGEPDVEERRESNQQLVGGAE